MQGSIYNSYLVIESKRLDGNIRAILGTLEGNTRLIPVLKTDAFGLGLVPIAKMCVKHPEIETIAVAQIGEGISLRNAGIKNELLVMGGSPTFMFKRAVEGNLTLPTGHLGVISSLAKIAKESRVKAKVEIKIEIGLHRIGLKPGVEIEKLICEIKENEKYIEISGAFSHFADPNDKERTEIQYIEFIKGVNQLKSVGIDLPRIHICGSAAYELYPEYFLDAVRIGRALYMDNPDIPTGRVSEIASWRSYITNIRSIKAGESLGYGSKYIVEKDALVATVGVGYGDGLSEELVKLHAPVLVNSKHARLLGCCMDQCQVDVTGIDCNLDDEVTFFGYDKSGNFLSSQEVALLGGENEGCGLTSKLGLRVERVYI